MYVNQTDNTGLSTVHDSITMVQHSPQCHDCWHMRHTFEKHTFEGTRCTLNANKNKSAHDRYICNGYGSQRTSEKTGMIALATASATGCGAVSQSLAMCPKQSTAATCSQKLAPVLCDGTSAKGRAMVFAGLQHTAESEQPRFTAEEAW